MSAAPAVGAAASFVWLGMVLAISFLEAPLKFRAPGVTLPIGLGIGRLVFRALNAVEALLATGLMIAVGLARPPGGTVLAAAAAVGLLVVQLVVVRPRLTRRSRAVLAGHGAARSRSHLVYVALEVAKVVALVATGAMLLGG